jgi:amidase
MASRWQDRAAEKRARIQASIPKEWLVQSPGSKTSAVELIASSDLLTPKEVEITRSAATDLVNKMSVGELTSVEVTLAFCKRAALVHQAVSIAYPSKKPQADSVGQPQTNCIHEFFPEAALAQAKELDAYFAENSKTVGPLHGLPISLKDQLRVKVRTHSFKQCLACC